MQEDTIAALSTPVGEGGIAVLRLSGSQAVEVAESTFRGADKPAEVPHRTAIVGHLVAENGDILDEVVLTVFRAPKSYTGEDVVEISCHGGRVGPALILERLLAAGARLATPGEFTRRAFENGRIDLAQAEAVADIISARSEAAHRSAMRQLGGELSRRIDGLRETLEEALLDLEARIDLEDDELVGSVTPSASALLAVAKTELRELLEEGRRGLFLRRGLRVAVIGRSNVGKSTLFNSLLRRERAIVTEEAGTTRDVIEGEMALGSRHVILVDTAGIRDSVDKAEKAGVERSRSQMREADLLLLVLDGSEKPTADDERLLRETGGLDRLMIVNKKDVLTEQSTLDLAK